MMVKVVFYHLLRSKYHLDEVLVHPGSIQDMIEEIIERYPQIHRQDLESSVVFYEDHPYHFHAFHLEIPDGSRIVMTHFVGGG